MKKKEREHLKEDPFQHFIEQSWEWLTNYWKKLIIGVAAVVVVLVIIFLAVFFKSFSTTSENNLYSKALQIKNDETLSLDRKIEQLSQLKSKSGISASVKLFLASLYFEKGDLKKSKEVLDSISSSRIDLVNEQKKLLEADILVASNKNQEALDLLNRLAASPQSEIPKESILLKMAKIQVLNEQNDTAAANLNKILEEYPQSAFRYEAMILLRQVEGK